MSLPADLEALLDDLRPAAVRAVAIQRRRRRVRLAAAATLLAAAFAGAALAADRYLGEPAPPSVNALVHELAAGFVDQPDLVAQSAQLLATAPDADLYGVADRRGSYCVELVGATRGLLFGTTCDLGFGVEDPNRMPGPVSLPQANVVVDGVAPPVVVYGKLMANAVTAEAILGDGTREPVAIGLERFFLYQPSEARQAVARRLPIEIEERDAAGRAVWTATYEPPLPLATQGTPVSRVSGRVEIAGAARLVARNGASPRRQAETVPLARDGSFAWTVPATGPRVALWELRVLDAHGHELAVAEPEPEQAWRGWLAQAQLGG